MSLILRLDEPHDLDAVLTPVLRQYRQWWSREVEARCDGDGQIVLQGSVSSYHHKQLAQETFRQLQPQRRICNQLSVRTLIASGLEH